MNIRWLERSDDFNGLEVSQTLMSHLCIRKKGKQESPDLRLIFNSRMHAAAFLKVFSGFDFTDQKDCQMLFFLHLDVFAFNPDCYWIAKPRPAQR